MNMKKRDADLLFDPLATHRTGRKFRRNCFISFMTWHMLCSAPFAHNAVA